MHTTPTEKHFKVNVILIGLFGDYKNRKNICIQSKFTNVFFIVPKTSGASSIILPDVDLKVVMLIANTEMETSTSTELELLPNPELQEFADINAQTTASSNVKE